MIEPPSIEKLIREHPRTVEDLMRLTGRSSTQIVRELEPLIDADLVGAVETTFRQRVGLFIYWR